MATGCYRDDLNAARVRIAELETELAENRAALERATGDEPPRHRRRIAIDLGGSVVLGLALAATMVSIAFTFVWERERDVSQRADQLLHELAEARADAMAAKEEARVAMDMLAQGARSDRPEGSDPPAAVPVEWGASEARWSDGDDSTGQQRRGSSVERGRGAAVIWATARPEADLTVDGVRYGRTPLMLRVEPGSHSLIYVHPTHGVRTRSLSVAADQTVRSDVVFVSD